MKENPLSKLLQRIKGSREDWTPDPQPTPRRIYDAIHQNDQPVDFEEGIDIYSPTPQDISAKQD